MVTYLGRRGCRIGENALITVERHQQQSDSSYLIQGFIASLPSLFHSHCLRVVAAFTNPYLTIRVNAKQEAQCRAHS